MRHDEWKNMHGNEQTKAVTIRDPFLSCNQRPIEGKVSKQADQGEWFNMNIVTYTRDKQAKGRMTTDR